MQDAARLAHDPMHKLLMGRDPIQGLPLASQPTLSRFENAPPLASSAIATSDRTLFHLHCPLAPEPSRKRTFHMSINPSYIGERPDIVRLVSSHATRVLDVGCSSGTVGIAIKRLTGAKVVGIEADEELAAIARQRLDQVFTGNVEEILQHGFWMVCDSMRLSLPMCSSTSETHGPF
ncbi:MAG: methyltransferase domain-containing protein [Candidatus Eisenbacteria bacterium]